MYRSIASLRDLDPEVSNKWIREYVSMNTCILEEGRTEWSGEMSGASERGSRVDPVNFRVQGTFSETTAKSF